MYDLTRSSMLIGYVI